MSNIKTATTYFYPKKSDDCIKQSYLEFDALQNETLSISYGNDGEILEKIEKEFDDKGRKISEQFYLAETETEEKSELKYNSKGEIAEEWQYFMDGTILVKKYQRNDDTKTLTISYFIDDEETEEKEIIRYNDKGLIVERKTWDDFGTLTEHHQIEYADGLPVLDVEPQYRTEYTYNASNELIKQVKRSTKGALIEAFVYEYDDKARLIRQQIVNQYEMKYIYNDEENTRTEQRFNSSGMLEFEKITLYENGNKVEELIPTGTIKYEYEFYAE